MARLRRARMCALILATALVAVSASSTSARGVRGDDNLTADLDGKPIALVEVGSWYCHDFDYPRIHCFSDPKNLEDSTDAALAVASVTYATIYEFTTYQGAYMHMSENYSILAAIGWNDRISSFVAKNSQSGSFWTDWLYGGTRYNFCCNQQLGSLGSYNDSFSSVFHN